MISDKKEIYEIVRTFESIVSKINTEINNLKQKLKIYDLKPEINKCYKDFYENILISLFKEKAVLTREEIYKKIIQNSKSSKKKLIRRTTVSCYLSQLLKHNYIEIVKDVNDKRKHSYKNKLSKMII